MWAAEGFCACMPQAGLLFKRLSIKADGGHRTSALLMTARIWHAGAKRRPLNTKGVVLN